MAQILKAYQIGKPGLIVEVDGASSIDRDNYSDSIQTLATADIIIKDFLVKEKRKYKHLEIYLSGDINNKIKALSKIVNIPYQGITFGTCYNNSLSKFHKKISYLAPTIPNFLSNSITYL